MITIKRLFGRGGSLAAVLALSVGIVVPSLLPAGQVEAATLTNRSMTMASNSIGTITTDANGTTEAAGSYYNGAQTKYTLNFTIPAETDQAISIMFCNSPLPQTTCAAPTGLSTSGFTGTVTSTGFSGGNTWTVDTTTVANTGYWATGQCSGSSPYRQNCILLTQSGATASTAGTVSITLGSASNGWITNPTSAQNFYARIQTFANTTYSTQDSNGAVAGSTTTGIDITSAVQEALNFSVAAANTATTPPTCTAETGSGAVALGTLSGSTPVIDSSAVYNANSYWRLNTNAANGTVVQYSGDTLKTPGGASSIPATGATAAAITAGTANFGMTIDSTNGAYSFTNLTRSAQYATTNYAFDTTSMTTPVTIASASTGTTVICDTAAMKYAATAATTTKPGLYKTSISYFAIPTF